MQRARMLWHVVAIFRVYGWRLALYIAGQFDREER